MDVHQSHAEVVKRLRRAEGHLATIIKMIGDGRPCLDLAQQLHAVESAINKAKVTLIQDHIDHCLETAAGPLGSDGRAPLQEFRAIAKYL
jgi:DNA-binding FrmR family transcriptional regulator